MKLQLLHVDSKNNQSCIPGSPARPYLPSFREGCERQTKLI